MSTTGVGALIGVLAGRWGVYQGMTGVFKMRRGIGQLEGGVATPFVHESPLNYRVGFFSELTPSFFEGDMVGFLGVYREPRSSGSVGMALSLVYSRVSAVVSRARRNDYLGHWCLLVHSGWRVPRKDPRMG